MKFKDIIDDLDIDETKTKPLKKEKVYTSVYQNVPHVKHYNYMLDLLHLPTTKDGYKYLLMCIDLGVNQFDIEPIKDKTPKSVLEAFKRMFKRQYIKIPYASIKTDAGTEFKGVFKKWVYDNNIFNKTAVPNRHKQMSSIENLNKNIGRVLNGYMNMKEEKTGKQYNEWTDILDKVRKLYNQIRKKKEEDPHTQKFISNPITESKFKVGDIVYYRSENPLDALGNKQPTSNFRVGDYRYNVEPRKIVKIIHLMGKVSNRYVLEGLGNVSYTDNEIIMNVAGNLGEKETKYVVKQIIDKRVKNKIVEYKVWFKGYPKKEASWITKKSLVKDGLSEHIKHYEKSQK